MIDDVSGGVTIKHFTQNSMKKLSFPLPPIKEQREIVDFLDKKCSKLEELIQLKENKIELLKSYKKSLIYECVTGKKEVRYAN